MGGHPCAYFRDNHSAVGMAAKNDFLKFLESKKIHDVFDMSREINVPRELVGSLGQAGKRGREDNMPTVA